MPLTVKATYRQGTLIPRSALPIPEESEVSVIVEGPITSPPTIDDPLERERILKLVADNMRQNPLPPSSPRFTREEMHGRR